MCRREKEGPSGEPLVRSSGTRGVTAIRRQGKDEWDKKDGCVCLPFAVCGLIPVHPRQPLSITPSLGCVLMVSVVGRQCYWFCEESWLRRDLKNGVMAGGSHRKDSLSFFFFLTGRVMDISPLKAWKLWKGWLKTERQSCKRKETATCWGT